MEESNIGRVAGGKMHLPVVYHFLHQETVEAAVPCHHLRSQGHPTVLSHRADKTHLPVVYHPLCQEAQRQESLILFLKYLVAISFQTLIDVRQIVAMSMIVALRSMDAVLGGVYL